MNIADKQAILAALRSGLTLRLASHHVGYELADVKAKMVAYPPFARDVRKAISDAVLPLVEKVRDSKDWRAAMAMLERTQPEDFGLRTTTVVEVTSPEVARRELAMLINPRHLMPRDEDEDAQDEDSDEDEPEV